MIIYRSGMKWGEGPRLHDGALWLSDTQGSRLWTDASGVWTYTELPSPSNGLWFLPDGRLVGSMVDEQRIAVWTGAEWETYADLSHLDPGPLGDMVGDSKGTLYVDDVGYSMHKGEQPRPGRILRVDADGSSGVAAEGLSFPNGLAFLDDGKTLVVAETTARRLSSFRVDAHGDLHDQKTYADIAALIGPEAAPDGIWATQAGVWVATVWGHAVALVRDGMLVKSIATGEAFPVACCSDGNARLFVTIANTAGLPLMDAIKSKSITCDVYIIGLEGGG